MALDAVGVALQLAKKLYSQYQVMRTNNAELAGLTREIDSTVTSLEKLLANREAAGDTDKLKSVSLVEGALREAEELLSKLGKGAAPPPPPTLYQRACCIVKHYVQAESVSEEIESVRAKLHRYVQGIVVDAVNDMHRTVLAFRREVTSMIRDFVESSTSSPSARAGGTGTAFGGGTNAGAGAWLTPLATGPPVNSMMEGLLASVAAGAVEDPPRQGALQATILDLMHAVKAAPNARDVEVAVSTESRVKSLFALLSALSSQPDSLLPFLFLLLFLCSNTAVKANIDNAAPGAVSVLFDVLAAHKDDANIVAACCGVLYLLRPRSGALVTPSQAGSLVSILTLHAGVEPVVHAALFLMDALIDGTANAEAVGDGAAEVVLTVMHDWHTNDRIVRWACEVTHKLAIHQASHAIVTYGGMHELAWVLRTYIREPRFSPIVLAALRALTAMQKGVEAASCGSSRVGLPLPAVKAVCAVLACADERGEDTQVSLALQLLAGVTTTPVGAAMLSQSGALDSGFMCKLGAKLLASRAVGGIIGAPVPTSLSAIARLLECLPLIPGTASARLDFTTQLLQAYGVTSAASLDNASATATQLPQLALEHPSLVEALVSCFQSSPSVSPSLFEAVAALASCAMGIPLAPALAPCVAEGDIGAGTATAAQLADVHLSVPDDASAARVRSMALLASAAVRLKLATVAVSGEHLSEASRCAALRVLISVLSHELALDTCALACDLLDSNCPGSTRTFPVATCLCLSTLPAEGAECSFAGCVINLLHLLSTWTSFRNALDDDAATVFPPLLAFCGTAVNTILATEHGGDGAPTARAAVAVLNNVMLSGTFRALARAQGVPDALSNWFTRTTAFASLHGDVDRASNTLARFQDGQHPDYWTIKWTPA